MKRVTSGVLLALVLVMAQGRTLYALFSWNKTGTTEQKTTASPATPTKTTTPVKSTTKTPASTISQPTQGGRVGSSEAGRVMNYYDNVVYPMYGQILQNKTVDSTFVSLAKGLNQMIQTASNSNDYYFKRHVSLLKQHAADLLKMAQDHEQAVKTYLTNVHAKLNAFEGELRRARGGV